MMSVTIPIHPSIHPSDILLWPPASASCQPPQRTHWHLRAGQPGRPRWVDHTTESCLPACADRCVASQISWPMVTKWPWMTFHRLCWPMARLHSQRKRCPTARLTQHAAPSTAVSPRTETVPEIHLNPNLSYWRCLSSSNTAPQEEPDATSQDASSTRSTSASVGADPVEETSNSLLLDSPHKEEQNEANNPRETNKISRPMVKSTHYTVLTSAFLPHFLAAVCASAPFIEINLEEAAQSEPSTTPPESPPSVPPFSSSPTSSLA